MSRRTGNPPGRRPGNVPDRFFAKVVVSGTGCWLWAGTLTPKNYGRFKLPKATGHRRMVEAHRWAYEFLVGPIPTGLTIDHLCRVRNCVNPAHMEPVTRAENTLRGEGRSAQNARKTHCIRGHAFSEANTYRHRTPHGTMGRGCKACHREYARARKAS